MTDQNKGRIYLGVYGIFVSDRKVLMIKKARGPYTGLYDLPGGGIEFEESNQQALKRELLEETGAELLNMEFLGINEYICEYTQITKTSHHIGIYYGVALKIDNLKIDPDGEDSLGAVFIPFEEITADKISPIAFPVIEKYINSYN
jgi:8-oxo-dGTP diphosphatase